MDLSPSTRKEIIKLINDLYYEFEAKFLGRFFRGPKLYLELVTDEDIKNSLEAIYRFVMADLYGVTAKIDATQVRRLAEVSRNYIEASRLKSINRALTAITGAKTTKEAEIVLEKEFEEVGNYMQLLTDSESERIIAYANRDGIGQVAASTGDSDPNVAVYVIHDIKACSSCKSMYNSPRNHRIPRVYKLSEMREGYFKKKEWDGITPFMPKLHPNCRCTMVYIPKGYGFDATGQIVYRGKEWDEYEEQRK